MHCLQSVLFQFSKTITAPWEVWQWCLGNKLWFYMRFLFNSINADIWPWMQYCFHIWDGAGYSSKIILENSWPHSCSYVQFRVLLIIPPICCTIFLSLFLDVKDFHVKSRHLITAKNCLPAECINFDLRSKWHNYSGNFISGLFLINSSVH